MSIWMRLFSLVLFVVWFFSVQANVSGCMICDEQIDSYDWFFNEDGSFGKLYEDEGYERKIFMDKFFNVEHEEYRVNLIDAKKLLNLQKENNFIFGSNNYWFSIPAKIVSKNAENILKNDKGKNLRLKLKSLDSLKGNDLYNLSYDMLKQKDLDLFDQNLFFIEVGLENENFYVTGNFDEFLNSIKVTFDLSEYGFEDAIFEKLVPVYIDKNKNDVLELSKNYNKKYKEISFEIIKEGVYALVVRKGVLDDKHFLKKNTKLDLILDNEYFKPEFEKEKKEKIGSEKYSVFPIFLNSAGIVFGVVLLFAFVRKKGCN